MSSRVGRGTGAPGIKVGIEIHQQLDTASKLFCACPTALREDPPHFSVKRRLKPTTSEMGDVDSAVLFESVKQKSFTYEAYEDTVCLVELDEEPPHDMNDEAVQVALTVALMANMTPVDEIHVMRKIVIDGSNTTGFQRTAKVAFGGYIMDGGERITIQSLCLEEDAARKVSEEREGITYRLDRLGIPLIEITTGPDMHSGDQAARVALSIGRLLRSTGKVKFGLGAIRQDLNVSVEGGARIEVKGVQELGLIPSVVEMEAQRQVALLEIREELRRRGVSEVRSDPVDLTATFSSTSSKVLRKAIDGGGRVFGARLAGFAGLLKRELQPGRRLGTELSDRAKTYAGVGGIFHSDELPGYGITAGELEAAAKALNAGEGDAIILVAAPLEACEAAVRAAVARAAEALVGVPSEVRSANADGTSRFMRPMPGSARMYPETDVPSIVVSSDRLEAIRAALPEPLDAKAERYAREYGLSKDLASLIADSPHSSAFERLVKEDSLPAPFVASTFEYTFKMLKREGADVDSLDKDQIREVLIRAGRGALAKEAVPEVLRWLASNKGKGVGDAVASLSLAGTDESLVRSAVEAAVSENIDLVMREGERAVSPLMGDLMKQFRGKVDGRMIHSLLKEEIARRLASK